MGYDNWLLRGCFELIPLSPGGARCFSNACPKEFLELRRSEIAVGTSTRNITPSKTLRPSGAETRSPKQSLTTDLHWNGVGTLRERLRLYRGMYT